MFGGRWARRGGRVSGIPKILTANKKYIFSKNMFAEKKLTGKKSYQSKKVISQKKLTVNNSRNSKCSRKQKFKIEKIQEKYFV